MYKWHIVCVRWGGCSGGCACSRPRAPEQLDAVPCSTRFVTSLAGVSLFFFKEILLSSFISAPTSKRILHFSLFQQGDTKHSAGTVQSLSREKEVGWRLLFT